MIKIEAAARLMSSTITAAGCKYDTPAKLNKFLLSIGFKRSSDGGGRSYLTTLKPFQSKLGAIKDEWDIKKGKNKNGMPALIGTNKSMPSATFSIQLPREGRKQSYAEIDQDSFTKKEGPVDIYNVTKYHPAWSHVNSVVDNMKDKTAVKQAINRYMTETGMNEQELQNSIRDRTTRKVSNKLSD